MPNRVTLNAGYPSILESELLWARAQGLIPAGTQTLAKGPGQYVNGVAPKYLYRGRGARVWDPDGNEYLDLSMAIGPVVLGYAHPAVNLAVKRQLDDGITFSLMHPLEVELAERIHDISPCAHAVRFAKTGAEATSAAVRVARAFTGRTKVLCCGYHGWHDWYIGVTDRHAGVPEETRELTYTFDYNDIGSLEAALSDDVACVILEPVVFQLPANNFLEQVKAACERAGALLVFDEMWTGFRLALGGAQAHYGVVPDLATFSKAIANGMPLSVLTGRADVMQLLERDVFFFSTFGGEALSLAAALATIREIEEHEVPGHLAALGRRLRDGYHALANSLGMSEITDCVGPACRTLVTFNPEAVAPLEAKSLVQQELLRWGILWSGTHTLSLAHTDEDIEYILRAYENVLPVLRDAIGSGSVRTRLRGAPVEPVFRRTGGFNLKPRT